jgi:hypothetical protein
VTNRSCLIRSSSGGGANDRIPSAIILAAKGQTSYQSGTTISGLKTMTGGADASAAYTHSPNDTFGQYRIIRPDGRRGMGGGCKRDKSVDCIGSNL